MLLCRYEKGARTLLSPKKIGSDPCYGCKFRSKNVDATTYDLQLPRYLCDKLLISDSRAQLLYEKSLVAGLILNALLLLQTVSPS